MFCSSQDPKPVGTGKSVAVSSSQGRLRRDTFSEREPLVDVVFETNEPIFRFSNPTGCEISSWWKWRSLAYSSEIKTDEAGTQSRTLNNCTNELQWQTYAQRLGLQHAHHGYVQSRREQVSDFKMSRSWKRKIFETLRLEAFTKCETWRELKKYESTNIFCTKYWEKVMTRYRGSLHRYMNCKKGWTKWVIQVNYQDTESICSENHLTFPVNQQSF